MSRLIVLFKGRQEAEFSPVAISDQDQDLCKSHRVSRRYYYSWA